MQALIVAMQALRLQFPSNYRFAMVRNKVLGEAIGEKVGWNCRFLFDTFPFNIGAATIRLRIAQTKIVETKSRRDTLLRLLKV
jgi:hypothetical protein